MDLFFLNDTYQLIEKVHLDDLGFICDNVYCVSNISFTLIISIETY